MLVMHYSDFVWCRKVTFLPTRAKFFMW